MFHSRLTLVFSLIFFVMIVVGLVILATIPTSKNMIMILLMMLALVVSTAFYLPLPWQKTFAKKNDFKLLYTAGYLSNLIIIVITFAIAWWEYNYLGSIGWWFYVIIIALTLIHPVVTLMLQAFSKK